jgi:peptidoglycan/LPS O-acetylase OafA/YrhL
MNTAVTSIATSTRQIHCLTPMRGIAAIWVMLFHIDVSLFYRDFGGLLPRDQTGLFSKGYLWVDFFFLLSGFVIAHVYSQQLSSRPRKVAVTKYLWARFARIYPLHLFTLGVLMVLTPIIAAYYPAVIDGSWTTYFAWSAVPSNLLLTQAMNQHVYLSWNMVSWSIAAEWWTYVLSIPCIIWLAKSSLRTSLIYALGAFLALVALVFNLPDKNLDITFNYGFLRCLFEFNIGLVLYQLFLREKMNAWLASDGIVIALIVAIVTIFHLRLHDLLIIPCFSLLILALGYNNAKTNVMLNKPMFQYLGKISYSIYMVHCLWFMVFWFLFPQLKSQWGITSFSLLERWSYAAVFIALTIISSHFTYHYIEIKCQRKLLAWFKPTK